MANSEGSYYPSPMHTPTVPAEAHSTSGAVMARMWSTPVNIPDWSKMIGKKQQLQEEEEEEYDGSGYNVKDGFTRTPPHEFVAKRMASVMSFSVHEGVGRTLKGRDLSTLRNAIWEKTGFMD